MVNNSLCRRSSFVTHSDILLPSNSGKAKIRKYGLQHSMPPTKAKLILPLGQSFWFVVVIDRLYLCFSQQLPHRCLAPLILKLKPSCQ